MEKVDFSKALGQIITQLRIERNISQEELAMEAKIDFTRLEEIERGEPNPFIDALSQLANVLGQKMGSLIIEAEELSSGVTKKTIPTVKPEYINRDVILPQGLTHDQLEKALNRALVMLDQIGLLSGGIQMNIYSGTVSNIVTKAIAETSDFEQYKDTAHPDLYNPNLDRSHHDWGLEMKATNRIGKGAESHNPGKGWFMIVVYSIVDGQTFITQVEVAQLEKEDWVIHDRAENSSRTRTAITREHATRKLRENSVYLDKRYTTPTLRKVFESKAQIQLPLE